jgi:hypothetical protein
MTGKNKTQHFGSVPQLEDLPILKHEGRVTISLNIWILESRRHKRGEPLGLLLN